MPSPVTMADIARRAGVSVATVSMSLRNKPNIPPATRGRITTLARRLGYQPNPFVSALMRSRRRGQPLSSRPILALVCTTDRADGWRNSPFTTFRLMREGARERAARYGYQAQEFWLHEAGMSPARFSHMLYTRGIQGLLLGPNIEGTPPPGLEWTYFSTVRIGMPLAAPAVPTICNDNFLASVTAIEECHRRGYRRPGLVLEHAQNLRLQRRWEGGFYAGRLNFPDLAMLEPLILEGWPTLPAFQRWLKQQKPDVIITPFPDKLHSLLESLDRRVPGDVGLAHLACSENSSKYSGIYQNGRLIGATAVEVLVSMVEHHEKGLPVQAVTSMVEGVWNTGATLRPLPAASSK
ncbi:MAG TPA: LacI family DNA-binding transcriptional regulator [Opitutaceae bacterium]|nr:LacI family DNA-binding transcriptional regulator [Opitutaceae bacterium]